MDPYNLFNRYCVYGTFFTPVFLFKKATGPHSLLLEERIK